MGALEDLQDRVARLREEKRRRIQGQQAASSTYREVQGAQDQAGLVQSRKQVLVRQAKNEALEGAEVDPIAQARGYVPTTPEDNAANRGFIEQTGGAAVSQVPGERLSTDVEGALGRGGIEKVAGDQRLVVDETGAGMATRNEMPSIPQHWKALRTGENGEASALGFAGNVLAAPLRALSTGVNYADAIRQGQETPGPMQALKDVGKSFIGSKDASPEDRMVVKRGSGMGDVLRQRGARLLAANPNATRADLLDANALGTLGVNLLPDVMATRLADMDDEDYDFMGEAVALPSDPLNYVGGAIFKGAGAVAKGAGRAAEKVLPAGVVEGAKIVGDEASDMLGKVFNSDLLGPGKRMLVERRLVKAGMDPASASKLAREAPQLVVAARAQEALGQQDRIAQLQDAADLIPEHEATTVNALLEGGDDAVPRLRDVHEGEALLRLRERAMKTSTTEAPSAFARLSTEEQGILRPLMSLTPAERGLLAADSGLDDAATAAREQLLDRLAQPRAHAWDLGRKMEVDLFEPHAWANDAARAPVLEAAKRFGVFDRMSGQSLKRSGLLKASAPLEGYTPHAPRSSLSEAMEKLGLPKKIRAIVEGIVDPLVTKEPYNPLRRREMVPLENLDQLRRAMRPHADAVRASRAAARSIRAAVRDGSLAREDGRAALRAIRNQASPHDDFAVQFAEDQAFQAKPVNQAKARWILDEGAPEELQDVLPVAKGLVEQRRGPLKTFETDPVKARAAHAAFTGPAEARANVGRGLADLVDTRGRRFVADLEDLIMNPRRGAPDRELIARRMQNGRARAGQLWIGSDHMPRDVARYVREQGYEYVDELVGRKMPALKGKLLPKPLAEEVRRMAGSLEQGAFERFAGLLGRVNNLWVPLVLNTPGFHIRNWMYGNFQVYLAIGKAAADPRLMRIAHLVASTAEHGKGSAATVEYLGRKWRIADLARDARANGIVETGRTADLERIVGRDVTYKDQAWKRRVQSLSPWSSRGVQGVLEGVVPGVKNSPTFNKAVVNRGLGRVAGAGGMELKGGANVENVQRVQVFLHNLAEGHDVIEASNQVRKFLFDYTGSSLSSTEKGVRKLLPFYQWLKFSTIQTVESMLKQPQKYAQLNHLFEMTKHAAGTGGQDPREVPAYLRDQGAVSLPGAEQSEKKRWMVSPQRPGAELNFLQPLVRGDAASFLGDKVAPQVGPGPKMLAERVTGDYLFGDRPISPSFQKGDPQNTWGEKVAGMKSEDMAGYFIPSLAGPVASMGFQIAGGQPNARWSGIDQGERLKYQGLSMAAGVKLAPVVPGDVSRQVQANVDEVMKAQGMARRSTGKKANADASAFDNWLLPYLEDDE